MDSHHVHANSTSIAGNYIRLSAGGDQVLHVKKENNNVPCVWSVYAPPLDPKWDTVLCWNGRTPTLDNKTDLRLSKKNKPKSGAAEPHLTR